jgi:hypothetical protein
VCSLGLSDSTIRLVNRGISLYSCHLLPS